MPKPYKYREKLWLGVLNLLLCQSLTNLLEHCIHLRPINLNLLGQEKKISVELKRRYLSESQRHNHRIKLKKESNPKIPHQAKN